MNKRMKKKELKRKVSEIVNMCSKVECGHNGDVVIFTFDPRHNMYGGKNLLRIESIFRRCRESGVEAFAIQHLSGIHTDVSTYKDAIFRLRQEIEHLESKIQEAYKNNENKNN